MAIFAPLSIGRQALLANERAIGVTGHNIANVNTKGFSRQEAVLSATRPDSSGFGTGVAALDGRALGRRLSRCPAACEHVVARGRDDRAAAARPAAGVLSGR